MDQEDSIFIEQVNSSPRTATFNGKDFEATVEWEHRKGTYQIVVKTYGDEKPHPEILDAVIRAITDEMSAKVTEADLPKYGRGDMRQVRAYYERAAQ